MSDFDGYYDIEAVERQKFLELDGVGESIADTLVERYNLFHLAVRHLLSVPNSWPQSLGRSRTDQIRDAMQAAGYEPPCGCSHYEEVRNSQDRDDVFCYCRTCGEVLKESTTRAHGGRS